MRSNHPHILGKKSNWVGSIYEIIICFKKFNKFYEIDSGSTDLGISSLAPWSDINRLYEIRFALSWHAFDEFYEGGLGSSS